MSEILQDEYYQDISTEYIVQVALYYAKRGWHIIPLHTPTINGCSCGHKDCANPGKHPRTAYGIKDASTDEQTIRQWWRLWGSANVGIVTGEISNMVVLDVDPTNNGDAFLESLLQQFGPLPTTVKSITGSGGKQFIFTHPGIQLKGKLNLAPGVDIRGDNGYMIVPPSVHYNGLVYVWDTNCSPKDTSPADIPEWMLEMALSPKVTLLTTGEESNRVGNWIVSSDFDSMRQHVNGEVTYDAVQGEASLTTSSSQYQLDGQGNNKRQSKVSIVSLSEVEPEDVHWLWHPYIPYGKITIVEGNPGQGKTFSTLGIAKHVSLGLPLPGDETRHPNLTAGDVLYITCEDGIGDTLVPRLISMGADLNKIHVLQGVRNDKNPDIIDLINLQDDLDALRAAFIQKKPKLLVIDPIQGFLGADMNRAEQVRPILSNLGRLAEEFDCATILIRHLAKGDKSNALYKGMGSIDFTAAARCVLLVGPNPLDNTQRVIVPNKNNLSELGKAIIFQINGGCFEWCGFSDIDIDDVINSNRTKSPLNKEVDEAISFLSSYKGKGLVSSQDLKKAAKSLGLSEATVQRAKQQLNIPSKKVHSNWFYDFGNTETELATG